MNILKNIPALVCASLLVVQPAYARTSAGGIETSKMLTFAACPTTYKSDAGDELAGAAALISIFAPKLINFGANVFKRALKSAAAKAEKARHVIATASTSYNFYTYRSVPAEGEPLELVRNQQAGCLVFISGRFSGEQKLNNSDLEPISDLRFMIKKNSRKPMVVGWEAKDEGGAGIEVKGFDKIDSYADYFRKIGLKEAPSLYIEAKIEPAFADVVVDSDDASKEYFQVQPKVVWYNKGIGSRGGDKKPTLAMSFSFTAVSGSRIFASDPSGEVSEANFSIALKNLPIGSIMGPDELRGIRTKPMPLYPTPEAANTFLSNSEREFLLAAGDAEEKLCPRKDCSLPILTSAELKLLRDNRHFFYIKKADYKKDPMLYIGRYAGLPETNLCEVGEESAEVNDIKQIEELVKDCRYRTERHAQALAQATLMNDQQKITDCLRLAGDDTGEKNKCVEQQRLDHHGWELKRLMAMEIINKYEGAFSDKKNDASSANQRGEWRYFGATIAEMTVTETRELGALYASILTEIRENDSDLLNANDKTALYQALFPGASGAAATSEADRLSKQYAYRVALQSAENADEDFSLAASKLTKAETVNAEAQASGSDGAKTEAVTILEQARREYRRKRTALLEAEGAANVAANAAKQPLPYPGIGGGQ